MGTSVGWGDWQNFRRMGGPPSPPRKKPWALTLEGHDDPFSYLFCPSQDPQLKGNPAFYVSKQLQKLRFGFYLGLNAWKFHKISIPKTLSFTTKSVPKPHKFGNQSYMYLSGEKKRRRRRRRRGKKKEVCKNHS